MPSGRPPASSASQGARVRDMLLWSVFLAACTAALQQQPYNAYPSPSSHSLEAAERMQRRYGPAADSLNTQLSGKAGFRDAHVDNAPSTPNERALATVAPAESNPAVRAPPAQRSSASTAGLNSRLTARSLQDWQVEDIILLATVDGSLHARDRKTGLSRWHLEADRPIVETVYHRHNKSIDENGVEQEDPLWIVEPSQDGSIYVYAPRSGFGMQRLGYTVKQLVELSPYASEGELAVAYTAEKKNTLYTVDARTGNILKMFSSSGSYTNNERSCKRVNPLENSDDVECESIGILTLGRTEYTIGIQDRNTGEQISTIKYFEWGPNNRDQDLRNKHTSTLDRKYVYTKHDGYVQGVDLAGSEKYGLINVDKAAYTLKFQSPVVRVYDVVKPQDDMSNDASLVVLPQPAGPPLSEFAGLEDEGFENIFVSCTESGSWYALSESNYPDVTHKAPTAQCYMDVHLPSLPLSKRHKQKFMGVHPLATQTQRPGTALIGAPDYPMLDSPVRDDQPARDLLPPEVSARGWEQYLPSVRTMLLALIVGLVGCGVLYRDRLHMLPGKGVIAMRDPLKRTDDTELAKEAPVVREPEPAQETIFEHVEGAASATALAEDAVDDVDDTEKVDSNEGAEAEPKKKKATRGKRSGKKAKEKEQAQEAKAAEKRGRKPSQVPQPAVVISVAASESSQVSGPLQINSLVIHTDRVIGQGSCGTSVFEGSFEGRAVAVKRMLSQYYDLASQEVSFLQQSDDHENVIRYYCQQKDDHFLYIAVELCQASLFETWEAEKARTEERQLQLRRIKHSIQQDIPKTLQQLAAGLYHLHRLRIIHRDIKPQNILVAFPKPFVDKGPRLVISDFGLGKNLPENVSTLVDPTGNAGTSGWKAPELISQPKESDGSRHSQSHSHTNGGSESAGGGAVSGVKRAADIFSLGCLFFWVLTDGIHPFEDDNGWTQLRELNIKRDNKRMEVLERWSDAYEPMQLITSMLQHQPENRPTALQVLNHPFFWSADKRLAFLCDVSDHFEREPRGFVEDYYTADSPALRTLESRAAEVIGPGHNFLARLDRAFVDTLGRQRKYSADRLLDLLRALRNKKNHYEDMPEEVKRKVGPLAGGYLVYWTARFPRLLMACYEVVHAVRVEGGDRFRGYFEQRT